MSARLGFIYPILGNNDTEQVHNNTSDHTRSWTETLEVASRLYKIVGEYRRTHLQNEDNLDMLLIRKRHYEKIYVELKVHDATLWEVKERLEASGASWGIWKVWKVEAYKCRYVKCNKFMVNWNFFHWLRQQVVWWQQQRDSLEEVFYKVEIWTDSSSLQAFKPITTEVFAEVFQLNYRRYTKLVHRRYTGHAKHRTTDDFITIMGLPMVC